MSRALFSQSIEHAMGAAGVDAAVHLRWREKARAAFEQVRQYPCSELAAILAQPLRTDDLAEIEAMATLFAEHFTDLVVVGMGGSSLGGETLAGLRKQGGLKLHSVDHIDPHEMAILLAALPWKTTAFFVVSKSGNTVEVQALLAIFLREAKAHGATIAKQFVVMTIPNDNPLHQLACEQGMRLVVHEDALCGRFSILSAVGLIPAAAVGVDIRALRSGAAVVMAEHESGGGAVLDAVALHMALNEASPRLQVLMHYCDRLGGLARWHRQCWSESLGKDARATTPIPSRGACDQHSQLQLYLAGPKDKFFTSLVLDTSGQGPAIDYDAGDERLAYLKGHRLGDLSMAEQRATNETLIKAGCPLRSFTFDRLDEAVMGGLLMQFTLEIVLVAELLGVNAFDQPAVEDGKRLTMHYLNQRHVG